MNREQRHKAIIKRRIFIVCCLAVLALFTALIGFAVKAIFGKKSDGKTNSDISESSLSSEATSSTEQTSSESTPSYPAVGPNGLDANFSILLLVNDKNPLPEDYDYEGNLTTIPTNYINGMLNQIDKDVWNYMKAMIDAQRETQTDSKNWLYVRSPYRSYATQKMLFTNQINRNLNAGLSSEEAETKAATVVTRPGRSEHNTGFSADFNIAEDSFESTPMFTWMQEHAAEYGFVLRFPKDKQDKTGIVYESWHYRFVGINTAKEMNRLNMCLEEYVEYLNGKKAN